MVRKDILRMSQKEINRVSIINEALKKAITQKDAACDLDLSDRQIRRIDGSMLITYKDRILKYKEINKPTKAKEETTPYELAVRKTHKPSANHPWRRFKPVVSEVNLINEVIHNLNNYPQKEKGSQKEKKRLLLINN